MESEALHTVRQRVFALVQQEVQRYAGTIQHFVDNACLAFFGAPLAQEDHARRAVLAALRLQECLRVAGTALGPGTAQERTVCLSVHTGEVIVGPIGADPRQIALAVGDTTQMADQLLRLAEPGAIVLSAATARLVQDFLRLDLVAPVNVPGVTSVAHGLQGAGARIAPCRPGVAGATGHPPVRGARARDGHVARVAGAGRSRPWSGRGHCRRAGDRQIPLPLRIPPPGASQTLYLPGRALRLLWPGHAVPAAARSPAAGVWPDRQRHPGRDGCQGPVPTGHRDGAGGMESVRPPRAGARRQHRAPAPAQSPGPAHADL